MIGGNAQQGAALLAQEYVQTLSDSVKKQIIDEYDRFERTGVIDECIDMHVTMLVRFLGAGSLQELGKLMGAPSASSDVDNLLFTGLSIALVNECWRYFARKHFAQEKLELEKYSKADIGKALDMFARGWTHGNMKIENYRPTSFSHGLMTLIEKHLEEK